MIALIEIAFVVHGLHHERRYVAYRNAWSPILGEENC